MAQTITKRPSTQITAETEFKAGKVLERLGITESSLMAMLYTYIANSGKIPAEMLQLSQEDMEKIEYEAAAEKLRELSKSRPRKRLTKENVSLVLHAAGE